MENISQPQLPMGVSFLNVAHTYVPNTKVECHYTIPFGMKSSTRDWIGIFKVNTSSIRDYETFVWAVPPENAGERSISHCSVQFQAYYLPHPGEQQYHFRYVDQCGSVRGCSEAFVFGEPQPMEEMVTLEDEDSCLDMLLIVPKATFLQNQLEMAQKERNDLMRARLALEEEVISKEKRICYLEAALDISEKTCFSLKEQCEDLVTREQIAIGERNLLNCQEAELRERILQLESEIQSMNKKMQEDDRVLEGTVAIKFSLETEKGELKQRLGETTVEIERYQLQVDSLREKLRSSQDMLSSSQQKALLMGEELASMSSIRDCTISDLHKSRLETADLAIKVSDLSVKFKEGMGQWWQEKTALNHSMEAKRDQIVNLKAEKLSLDNSLQEERSQRHALQCKLNQETDARQVQLSENRRELSELKSALKVTQMEKEQLIEERQEIHQYVRRLEERLDKLADEKWKEDKMLIEDKTDSSPPTLSVDLSDSDDESPGDEGVSQQLGPCSLDEQDLSLNLPVFPCEPQKVVINQPAPIACQLQPLPEDNPDSW